MTFHKTILASIFLLFFITGCNKEKDELTLPVNILFKMSIKMSFSMDDSLNAEYLNFTDCILGVGNIVFKGKREEGGDYYFETDPNLYFSVFPLKLNSQPIIVCDFDLPQGTYTDMKWGMWLWAIPGKDLLDLIEGLTVVELLATGVEEDLGDGWVNGPGIAISGIYKFLDGSEIPFLLAGDFILARDATDYYLWAETFDSEDNSSIVLSADKHYESTLIFSLENDFRSLNRELFEEAKVSGDSVHPVIIISGSNNKDLYENLTSRINLSIKVIIKEI